MWLWWLLFLFLAGKWCNPCWVRGTVDVCCSSQCCASVFSTAICYRQQFGERESKVYCSRWEEGLWWSLKVSSDRFGRLGNLRCVQPLPTRFYCCPSFDTLMSPPRLHHKLMLHYRPHKSSSPCLASRWIWIAFSFAVVHHGRDYPAWNTVSSQLVLRSTWADICTVCHQLSIPGLPWWRNGRRVWPVSLVTGLGRLMVFFSASQTMVHCGAYGIVCTVKTGYGSTKFPGTR